MQWLLYVRKNIYEIEKNCKYLGVLRKDAKFIMVHSHSEIVCRQ